MINSLFLAMMEALWLNVVIVCAEHWIEQSRFDHCDTFLHKTVYSDSASLHPGVEMVTGELLRQPDRMLGRNMQGTSISSRGGAMSQLGLRGFTFPCYDVKLCLLLS